MAIRDSSVSIISTASTSIQACRMLIHRFFQAVVKHVTDADVSNVKLGSTTQRAKMICLKSSWQNESVSKETQYLHDPKLVGCSSGSLTERAPEIPRKKSRPPRVVRAIAVGLGVFTKEEVFNPYSLDHLVGSLIPDLRKERAIHTALRFLKFFRDVAKLIRSLPTKRERAELAFARFFQNQSHGR